MTSHRGRPTRSVEDGLEVVRKWRPPERPLNALGFPPGTSQIPGASLELRRGADDVVQGWTPAAAVAASRSGKPSVFVFQGVLHENDLAARPRVRSMLMRAARDSDVVTTYSDAAAHAFERLTGLAARAIEPGIRLDAFTLAADPVAARHAQPAIFCAADPEEPRKRVGLLVEAFGRLRDEVPEAELWLMATSDPALARTPGVRIVEPGADRDELVRLYRSAWVTVLPAFREAFGLVVAESLACGTPAVVMSDGAGVLEILGAGAAGSGWVADPDPELLARVLAQAVRQPPGADVVAACRERAEGFSIERCAEQYEALYDELTRSSR